MKNLNILFFFILVLGLTSCNNDSENNTSIVGKWEYYYEERIVDGEQITSSISTECGTSSIDFNKDGSFINISNKHDETIGECSSNVDNGIWSKEGNILIVESEKENLEIESKILTLNETTLKLEHTTYFEGKIIDQTIREFQRAK